MSVDEYYTDDLFVTLLSLTETDITNPSDTMNLLHKKIKRRAADYKLSVDELLRLLCSRSVDLTLGEQYQSLLSDYLNEETPAMAGFNKRLGSIFDDEEVTKFTPLFDIYYDKFRPDDQAEPEVNIKYCDAVIQTKEKHRSSSLNA